MEFFSPPAYRVSTQLEMLILWHPIDAQDLIKFKDLSSLRILIINLPCWDDEESKVIYRGERHSLEIFHEALIEQIPSDYTTPPLHIVRKELFDMLPNLMIHIMGYNLGFADVVGG
jgi:hypothetical protein